VPDWFAASPEERQELTEAIAIARDAMMRQYQPAGFNLGVNIGAAGQTVFHLHVHVILRYDGDGPDPRGGVRHVLPARANYFAQPGGLHLLPGLPHQRALVRGGGDPLLPHLLAHLDAAHAAAVAVAFTLESGVRAVREHLRDLLRRGGRLRFLTGDYLDATEPRARSCRWSPTLTLQSLTHS
jgi:hypothetical protein